MSRYPPYVRLLTGKIKTPEQALVTARSILYMKKTGTGAGRNYKRVSRKGGGEQGHGQRNNKPDLLPNENREL